MPLEPTQLLEMFSAEMAYLYLLHAGEDTSSSPYWQAPYVIIL
jgi:hypothetical protein